MLKQHFNSNSFLQFSHLYIFFAVFNDINNIIIILSTNIEMFIKYIYVHIEHKYIFEIDLMY